jgi:hypothetical protein
MVAGQDGANVQTIKTDTSGRQQVVGPVAAGSATAADAPVKVGGSDGTNVQTMAMDTSGHVFVVSTQVNNSAPVNPFLQALYDGTNAQYAFFCSHQAAITITAGTDAVIVAGTAAKKTIVCHLDFASNTAATFTIQEGTGSTCGTGTAAVTGGYQNTGAAVFNYGAVGALRTATAADDLCLHSSASVTVGGFVTYAQF